jgi:hypothetical protein
MKMNIDITKNLLDQTNNTGHEKKAGRYSCSQIYPLLNGWVKPEDYLKQETFDFENAFRMWQGSGKHEMIQSLMPEYFQEVKKEMEVDGMTIVGMADLINDEEVIEIKTSEKLHDKAKKWHEMQLKLYLVLFDRPKGKIVQPCYDKKGLYLKVLGEYKQDKNFFNKTMEKLKVIDEQIKAGVIDEDLELQRIKEDPDLQKND